MGNREDSDEWGPPQDSLQIPRQPGAAPAAILPPTSLSTAGIMSFSCLSAVASPASFFRSKLINSLEFNTGQADTNEANSPESNRILQYHLLPATVGPFIYRTMAFIYFYSFK